MWCLYGSGGCGVCWGSSGGFCQYASRDVVCWGGVGSGGDSNIVSNAGIAGISSLGGDDINVAVVSVVVDAVSAVAVNVMSVVLLWLYLGSLMVSMINFESFSIPFHDK